MDGQEHHYVGSQTNYRGGSDYSEARLKTITFYDDTIGADRVIDFEHNVQMDFDYALTTDFSIHDDDEKLFIERHPGNGLKYYPISKNDVRNNTANYQTWVNVARGSFRSSNLNYYVGGDTGAEVRHNGIPGRGTVIHKLTYPTPFKVSNSLGGGYIFVSERGGNNSQYLVARDVDNNILGAIRVQQSTDNQCHQDINNPNVSYVNTGRAQNNGQEICMAIFPLRDLASPGTSIKSIELLSVDTDTKGWHTEGSYDGDPADGKIFLVHELAEPDVCYDYSVRQGGHTLASKDRKFTAVGSGDISIAMGLKSMESDYDMMHSRVSIRASGLTFDEAQYSPNHVNRYEDAIYIHEPGSNDFDSSHPEIAIGNDPQSGDNGGGTIKANERYFSKYIYNSAQGDKTFNIDLNITVDISEGQNNPIVYLLTSDPLKYNAPDSNYTELKRCEQSQTYNPEWLAFNVERTDSADPAYTQDNERYPLYTQVAGKDFDFSVVAYDANSSYKTPLAISDTTVEVELIDVSSYDDNNSFFRCSDPNPEIIQNFGTDKKRFVYFDNNKKRVDVTDDNDLDTSRALRNAAFRMWVLVDTNNTLLHHHCTDNNTVDNTCFQTLYDNNLSSQDTQGYCSNCSAYTGGCYQCLKDHFAIPICSRDNFSIRPEAFHIAVSDTDEKNAIDTTSHYVGDNHIESTAATLAAGYKYTFDANATVYGSDTNALGYQKDFYDLPNNTDVVSRLSFDTSTGTSCADKNATEFPTRFFDGKIIGTIHDTIANPKKNLQSNANVGKYTYHMHDINWTMVDQARFTYKTFPGVNDCEGMDASNQPDFTTTQLYATATDKNGKSGCGISSNYQQNGINNYDLALRFEPYKFDVSDVNLTLPHDDNNFTYFNSDIDDADMRYMSAHFESNITAVNKQGEALSNYTSGCAAHRVNYDVNFTISRFDSNLTADLYPFTAKDSNDTNHTITLFRNYVDDQETDNMTKYSNYGDINSSNPADISASQFKDDDNGTATVNLYYNFNRAANAPLNPLRITFNSHHVDAPEANVTSAHLISDYTPEGNLTQKNIVDFVYGRVIMDSPIYTLDPDEDTAHIATYVEVYCEGNETECLHHNIETKVSVRDPDSSWNLYAPHDSTQGDGYVAAAGTDLTIQPTPASKIDISENPTDVNATITVSGNYDDEICLTPDVPYLDKTCSDIERIAGGGWAGTGKTGLIVDTNASTETRHRRSSW